MYSIETAAQKSGLSVHTLRYYERAGILPQVGRNGAGHRRFSEEDMGRIQFITLLKDTGMALCDIREFVESGNSQEGRSIKRHLLKKHQTKMRAKMAQLQACTTKLEEKIAFYGGKDA